MVVICKDGTCQKRAYYSFDNKTPEKCKEHKEIGMKAKKTECKCGKAQPIYGLIDDNKPTCCNKCKTPQMINIVTKKCLCGKVKPNFGLITDKLPTCCAKCKTNDMINIKDKKCICGKSQPVFGLLNDKIASCCIKCKTEDMIDLKNKLCPCGTRPVFGLPDDKIATCCSKCKTEDMINIKDKLCPCGTQPTFGYINNNQRICCIKCKKSDMIDLSRPRCKANEQGIICTQGGNKKYKGYCTRCYANLFPLDPLTFLIRCKTKEIAVRDYLNANYINFHHDRPLWIDGCDCTHRRRIDHRRLIGNTLLCVGTDEFQHKGYNKHDEIIRYDDLMMIHGGKFIYVRFNPDKYKENGIPKNPTIATRLRELSKVIDIQIKRIENDENTEMLEIIKMYYDN